jgi:uncharacterized protein (UPF0548 family)
MFLSTSICAPRWEASCRNPWVKRPDCRCSKKGGGQLFALRRPSERRIGTFIHEQARLSFTYSAVGATASSAPPGFQSDHFRCRIGSGKPAFKQAKAALERWKQFDQGWARAYPDKTPIEANQTVAVIFRILGLWCVCSARIVYVVDEPTRFGFAYGTLPGHVESGEERFLVERAEDGTVWYDVRAFSRPRHILARIGYPLVRCLQRRFVRNSGALMRRAAES